MCAGEEAMGGDHSIEGPSTDHTGFTGPTDTTRPTRPATIIVTRADAGGTGIAGYVVRRP